MAKWIKYITIVIVALIFGIGMGFGIGQLTKKKEIEDAAKIDKIDIRNDIEFESRVYTYDNKPHSLKVTGIIPDTFEITYVNNNKINVGSYDVVAKFSNNPDKYIIPEDMKAVLTILPGDVDLSYDDMTYEYTGSEITHTILNLDDRFEAVYYNNVHTESGTYTAYAIIKDKLNNYNDIILTSTMTINNPNEYGIYLENKEVIYTGESYTLLCSGNIEEAIITYENNVQTSAGEYDVIAHISDPLGEKEAITLSAKLVIKKAQIPATFESKTILYTGEPISISCENVPEDVTVSYYLNDEPFNGAVSTGGYNIKAKLNDPNGNYYDLELEATLTITNILSLKMDSKKYVSDGTTIRNLIVEGELPDSHVTVTYYFGNDVFEGTTVPGEYLIYAEVVDELARYAQQTLTGTLTIVSGFPVYFCYGGNTIATIYVEKGSKVTDNIMPPVLEEDGYTYYWELESGNPLNVQTSIRYNMQRDAESYAINYHTNYAHENPTTYTKSDSAIVLSPIEASGYVFAGWYTDPEYTNFIDQIEAGMSGAIDLYPKIVPAVYTINYYSGATIVKSTSVAYECPFRLYEYNAPDGKTSILWRYNDELLRPNTLIESYNYTNDVDLYAIMVNKNFSFDVILKDNTYLAITKYNGGSIAGNENIYIPEYYLYDNEYYPVKEISAEAFHFESGSQYITSIEKVVIPAGVTVIGERAFAGLTSLKGIELPESLKEIGVQAFAGCTSLNNINLNNVEIIKNNAFNGCTSLTEVECTNLKVLTTSVFEDSGLERIMLGEMFESFSTNSLPNEIEIIIDMTRAEFEALDTIDKLPDSYIVHCSDD